MSAGGIRPRLLVVWLVFLVLVGAIVATELGSRRGRESNPRARMLLPVPVEQLGAIEVAHAGALHRFERDAAGAWFYHSHGVAPGPEEGHRHQADPALAGRIEHAVAGFGRTQIERQFALESHGQDYGVTTPKILILIYRLNDREPLAQFAVGDIAPDALSRYVLPVGGSAVTTIPNYQIDNLLALIEAVGGASDQGRTLPGPKR